MKIRPLAADDLTQIQQIYAYYVLHSTGSWEWEPPSLEKMKVRAQSVQEKGLPFLVAEVAEKIAGYAYASLYRPRAGYASPWKTPFISILNSASRELGFSSCRNYWRSVGLLAIER